MLIALSFVASFPVCVQNSSDKVIVPILNRLEFLDEGITDTNKPYENDVVQ